jgi:hypothetical protein
MKRAGSGTSFDKSFVGAGIGDLWIRNLSDGIDAVRSSSLSAIGVSFHRCLSNRSVRVIELGDARGPIAVTD